MTNTTKTNQIDEAAANLSDRIMRLNLNPQRESFATLREYAIHAEDLDTLLELTAMVDRAIEWQRANI